MEKNLLKHARVYRAIVLVLFVLALALNLSAILLPLSNGLAGYSIWSLAREGGATTSTVYALCLKFGFFLGLVGLVLSALEVIRNKASGNFFSAIYFLVFGVAFFGFQIAYHSVGVGLFVLILLSMVIATIGFAFSVRAKALTKTKAENVPVKPESKRAAVGILVTIAIGLLGLLLCLLFVPVYAVGSTSVDHVCVLGQVLISERAYLEDSVYCLINVALFVILFLYFISSLSYFWSDKKRFVLMARKLMWLEVAVSFEFFMLGYIIQFAYSLQGFYSESISFIPFVIFCALTLPFSILKGQFDVANGIVDAPRKGHIRFTDIEPLVYLLLVTAVTVVSLFFNIIDVKFDSTAHNEDVTLTGLKLLQDYPNLGSGYQVLAFGIMLMVICSGIGLVLALSGFFSRYKHFPALAKAVTYVNVFFIFVFGVAGIYFTIATQITEESTLEVIRYYFPAYTKDYTYSIHSDAFYCLLVDVIIVAVMIIRKALDGERGNLSVESANVAGGGGTGGTGLIGGEDETAEGHFDPCPAFSQIDAKEAEFAADLTKRKAIAAAAPSLSGLVKFVVTYAKDSRLHLSYSYEDMATFVAGLGACRLSILQGMSGTGKTSLPKIFSEAIAAKCDLIEVESSWKDKNELLGYYNEFSEKFTPKKFTQALYAANLNTEIPTFIVLDEMNLSRIEYYFSDFLSLMENEPDKRELKLLNINLRAKDGGLWREYKALKDGSLLKVPSNVWFIGTANRDESTFVISDKVYDRAYTMNFSKRAPKVRDYGNPIPQQFYSAQKLLSLYEDAKAKGTFDAESNNLIKSVEELLLPFNISFGNRILRQIEDFVDIYEECFPGRNVQDQAVETILLSKVVAKLEVKTIDDKEELVRQFADLGLARCADFISKLNED
ncbi:MAG: hypothetical protein LKG11_05790 [Bacilli bacterium]|jgi:hypothetical protein|nr:hypothetical protein [Bacilli bacterium]